MKMDLMRFWQEGNLNLMLNTLRILHLDINMINEKMNELLILYSLLSEITEKNIEYNGETRMIKRNNGTYYNVDKMQERAEILVEEFMEPYAI